MWTFHGLSHFSFNGRVCRKICANSQRPPLRGVKKRVPSGSPKPQGGGVGPTQEGRRRPPRLSHVETLKRTLLSALDSARFQTRRPAALGRLLGSRPRLGIRAAGLEPVLPEPLGAARSRWRTANARGEHGGRAQATSRQRKERKHKQTHSTLEGPTELCTRRIWGEAHFHGTCMFLFVCAFES